MGRRGGGIFIAPGNRFRNGKGRRKRACFNEACFFFWGGGGRMGAGGIAAAFVWLWHTTEIPKRDEELFLGMWEQYAFTPRVSQPGE